MGDGADASWTGETETRGEGRGPREAGAAGCRGGGSGTSSERLLLAAGEHVGEDGFVDALENAAADPLRGAEEKEGARRGRECAEE